MICRPKFKLEVFSNCNEKKTHSHTPHICFSCFRSVFSIPSIHGQSVIFVQKEKKKSVKTKVMPSHIKTTFRSDVLVVALLNTFGKYLIVFFSSHSSHSLSSLKFFALATKHGLWKQQIEKHESYTHSLSLSLCVFLCVHKNFWYDDMRLWLVFV